MLPPCLYIMHMYHSLPSIWYGRLFNLTQSESRKPDSTLYFLHYQGDETWSHHSTGFVFFCEIILQIFSHLYCGGSSLLFWFRGLFLKNITFSLSYIANSLGGFFQLMVWCSNLHNFYNRDVFNFSVKHVNLFPIYDFWIWCHSLEISSPYRLMKVFV